MFVGVTWLGACLVYSNEYDSALPEVTWNKTVPSLWEYSKLGSLKMYHNICITFTDVTVTIREAINSFITDFLRL